jgi:hypothetical protein
MATEKEQVLEFLQGKTGKSKFYFNDFCKIFPDKKPREVKKVLTELVNEGKVIFWSSGSTSMYGLAGVGKQQAEED